jgi:hypothetical protein
MLPYITITTLSRTPYANIYAGTTFCAISPCLCETVISAFILCQRLKVFGKEVGIVCIGVDSGDGGDSGGGNECEASQAKK